MDPEYLVIEPTGVGKLGNILSSIRRIEYERISLLPSVVVLAPRSINSYLKEFPEIYTDQVKHASKIVFSKSENESPDVLQRATEQIRAINENAEIISSHYSTMDDQWWNALFETSESAAKAVETPEYRKNSLKFGLAQNVGQPQQFSFKDVHLSSPAELIVLLEDVLRGRFGYIPRAKGLVLVGAKYLRFDLADGLYAIIGADENEPKSQCTFIGNNLDVKGLRSRFIL
jgi:G3E family GTPase